MLSQTYTPTPQSSLCPNGHLTEAELGGGRTSWYSHTFEHPLSPEGNISGTWTAHNEKRQALIRDKFRALCFKSNFYSQPLGWMTDSKSANWNGKSLKICGEGKKISAGGNLRDWGVQRPIYWIEACKRLSRLDQIALPASSRSSHIDNMRKHFDKWIWVEESSGFY